MMMKCVCVPVYAVVSALVLLAGCSTPDILREPKDIPALVNSYEIPGLRAHTGNVPVILDLAECVDYAVMSSDGFSGRSSIAGRFPVRELVHREFNKVIAGNFRMALPDEHPRLVFEIDSERIIVKRSWSKIKCDMVFSVKLVDPVSTDKKPYFHKKYRMQSTGVHKNKEEVPVCVYAEIQNFARMFLEDIPKEHNGTLITRIKELGVDLD